VSGPERPAGLAKRRGHVSSSTSLAGNCTATFSAHDPRSRSAPPLIIILALMVAGCATALKPEDKLVSSVQTVAPVQVPLAVRCVKEVPPVPAPIITGETVKQRYYEMKAKLAEYKAWAIRENAIVTACATEEKP